MQHLDTFSYKGEHAEAIAISERFRFNPTSSFGIETSSWATSNYRGFWCDYVIDEVLIIQNLYVFSKNQAYPSINGVQAEHIPEFVRLLLSINSGTSQKRKYSDGFPMQYKDINFEINYTGKIAIGTVPKPNKAGETRYRQVLELTFEEGVLLETADITQEWKETITSNRISTAEYWWAREENDYFRLINYGFMGLRETPS